jgi:F-type H+-transporting ATPase subunit b
MEFGDTFWVGLSFILFVAVVYKPVGRIITNGLDNRSQRIQEELEEALRLKEEAQALLSAYERNQKEVTAQASDIISHEEKEAARITNESKKALEESLNKRVQLSMEKIAAYEDSVMQEIRNHSVDIAIDTVRSIIEEHMQADIAEELVTKAV